MKSLFDIVSCGFRKLWSVESCVDGISHRGHALGFIPLKGLKFYNQWVWGLYFDEFAGVILFQLIPGRLKER